MKKTIQSYNSTLKRSPLKSHQASGKCKVSYHLSARTPLKKVSKKQEKKNQVWAAVKIQRVRELQAVFDYLPCEYCMAVIRQGQEPVDPHHNDGDRNNNTFDNCRIVHRNCHTFITDNNVPDVKDRLKG